MSDQEPAKVEGNPNLPDAGPPNAEQPSAPPVASESPPLMTEFEAAANGLYAHAKDMFSGAVHAASVAEVESRANDFVNHVLALIRTAKS